MRTTHLRSLMKRLAHLRAEHQRQWASPSRGYNEDAAIAEMDSISDQIDAELDRIDSNEKDQTNVG